MQKLRRDYKFRPKFRNERLREIIYDNGVRVVNFATSKVNILTS